MTIAFIVRENVIRVIDEDLRIFWGTFLDLLCQIKMWIDFVKFTKDVICSTEGSPDAVGFEFNSVEDLIIPPSNVRIVWTDIGFKIPSGSFSKFHSRSSFALQFIDVGGGVIDADYRALVAIMFFN